MLRLSRLNITKNKVTKQTEQAETLLDRLATITTKILKIFEKQYGKYDPNVDTRSNIRKVPYQIKEASCAEFVYFNPPAEDILIITDDTYIGPVPAAIQISTKDHHAENPNGYIRTIYNGTLRLKDMLITKLWVSNNPEDGKLIILFRPSASDAKLVI